MATVHSNSIPEHVKEIAQAAIDSINHQHRPRLWKIQKTFYLAAISNRSEYKELCWLTMLIPTKAETPDLERSGRIISDVDIDRKWHAEKQNY